MVRSDALPDPNLFTGLPPYVQALMRALGTAVFVFLTAAATAWATTDNVKLIVQPALVAALAVVGVRFGFEGAIDTFRASRKR